MAVHLEIGGAHKRTLQGNNDWYYGGGAEAWPNLNAALAGVDVAVRLGKTIGIVESAGVVEYWWKNGTADNDLVLKNYISTNTTPSYQTLAQIGANNDSTTVWDMGVNKNAILDVSTYPTGGGGVLNIAVLPGLTCGTSASLFQQGRLLVKNNCGAQVRLSFAIFTPLISSDFKNWNGTTVLIPSNNILHQFEYYVTAANILIKLDRFPTHTQVADLLHTTVENLEVNVNQLILNQTMLSIFSASQNATL